MKAIVFDVETVPDGRLIQKIHYPQEPNVSPLEAIARYQKERLEASGGKNDFIPATYHVPVSVAMIKVNETGLIESIKTLDKPQFRPYEISRQFWHVWEHYNITNPMAPPTPLVTFNGRGFDLPVMELSAYRYGISVREWFYTDKPTYSQPRYRYTLKYHMDLMELLTNFGTIFFEGGLNLAATLLGKPGKMQVKGSEILHLWQEGKHDVINNYCLCDALDTYFIYLRTQVLRGLLSLSEERNAVHAAKSFLEDKKEAYFGLEEYLENFTYWQEPNEANGGFIV